MRPERERAVASGAEPVRLVGRHDEGAAPGERLELLVEERRPRVSSAECGSSRTSSSGSCSRRATQREPLRHPP